MIDAKHILTVGVDDEAKTIYDDYIDQLGQKIVISEKNSKAALKALMNILITLEEQGPIRKGYDSLPSFFITHRMVYMKLYDDLSLQGFQAEQMDNFWFHGKELPLKSNALFIDEYTQTIRKIFEIFQPFLDADDDVDRFMRVVTLYSGFLKTKNDASAMVQLLHHFAAFADKVYLAGYKKVNDGWGGKLDLDTDIYPAFFKQLISEVTEPNGFSEYIIGFLYDRLKEVGEAETVLPDLYDFEKSLNSHATLKEDIKEADAFLLTEIEKTINLIQQQKGEALTQNAQNAVVRELTAYERLEGVIYYYFDERRLFKIMNDTQNASFYEKTVETVQSFPPKIKHYVMYAFGKLLGAPNSTVKLTDAVVEMFCRQIKMDVETMNGESVMNNLPAQYRYRVPDLEVRFVFNRMMTYTTSLEGFEKVHELFREYLTDQTDFPLIHEMFIERAAEKRHASALMSFYVASLLVYDLGDVVSEQLIKVLAGRLSLTFSFTRRLTLFQEIKRLRYEFDGTHGSKETMYYNGFDKQNAVIPDKEKKTPLKDRPFEEQWLIMYHFINNREMAQSLRLLDEQILFDYIYKREHTQQELDEARMELRGKVYKIMDDKFLDLVTDEEDFQKHEIENQGKFAATYYGKYEKIRSILIAQFVASGWDQEVHELRRKGKKPQIRMTQNELLRNIKNIDPNRIREQYEYKEARETIDVNTLRKQVEAREQLLAFVNRGIREEAANHQKLLGLTDEALALLSYSSTKLRSSELRVELGVRQLVERLRADLGVAGSREPLPLDAILQNCFAGKYGKIDIKVIKKDKNGQPLIDPETGEEAEKTYTITPEKFPDYLKAPRAEVEALSKSAMYRMFYLITLSSILSETFSSMTFIKEALSTNKYVIAADGLKGQSLENQEIIEYARIKMETASQLAPFELQHAVA